MHSTQEISSSLEDYLETILHLQEQRTVARGKDIGDHLHVSRSSVTSALQSLAKRGLVNYSPYDFITLTPEGRKAAEYVAQRHEVMRQFLIKVLRVEDQEADAAACRLEHALSDTVLGRFVSFMEFVNRCPAGIAGWSAETGFRCTHFQNASPAACATCDQHSSPPACIPKKGRLPAG